MADVKTQTIFSADIKNPTDCVTNASHGFLGSRIWRNIIGEILVPNHRPQMASVKPGILGKTNTKKNTTTEVITFGYKVKSSRKTKPTEIRQKVFN